MHHQRGVLPALALVAVFATLTQPTARAIDIRLSFGGNFSWPQAAKDAAERAAADWEGYLEDDFTVTVGLQFKDLTSNVIAQALAHEVKKPFNEVRNAVIGDAIDEGGDDAAAKLLGSVTANMFELPSGFTTDGNLKMTRANASALGFVDPFPTLALDGIEFNNNPNFVGFDFEGSDPTKVDFESVVRHELGHILGFLSAVDAVDPASDASAITPFTLDLFRFDPEQNPRTARQFAMFNRSLVPGVDAVFSDLISNFEMADAELYGGSHWADSGSADPIGLMDPTLAVGEISKILRPDLRALDLIGYEVVTQLRYRGRSAVATARIPEPGTLSLVALGCGLAVASVRRQRA